jgi:hypothetical protein
MTSEMTKARQFLVRLPVGTYDTTLSEYKDPGTGRRYPLPPFIKTPNEVRFTKSLMEECVYQFTKFFNQFQVVSKQPMLELQDKITAWNQEVERRLEYVKAPTDVKVLQKEKISPQASRALLQFHRLHGKYTMKELVPKEYSRTTYWRVSKLYERLTGQKGQIAHAYFSPLIQRNIGQIYEKLYSDIHFSFLTNFYNIDQLAIANLRLGS